MLIDLFYHLRHAELPVTIREYLDLLGALQARVAPPNLDDFYYLARTVLIKDERHYDRFDQAFGRFFEETLAGAEEISAEIPDEWLRKTLERYLSEEDKQKLEALGWEKLMETLKERLREQDGAHHGGSKWIGTGGTSPFGAYGYHPEGVRIGQEESRNRRAVKVWDKREFRNFDDSVELGTRNIKVALRRLRQFARTGAPEELDLDDTIRSTADRGGLLDLKMVPERHNAVKVLLFLDVGGSMDDHVRVCEELFSACRVEFKHLEYFYFHNCVYEKVWRDNRRRYDETTPTWEVLHTYGNDYKLIFVGDATMSPYEILYPHASVEHWNDEPGQVWLQRLLNAYPKAIWLNPQSEAYWSQIPSIQVVQEIIGPERMFPLTLEGLEAGIRHLAR
ncbi:MAG: VWA domain-containing protein [Gammaproteobacteria bacterium]